jgi:transcriptional regulator with XRE-family HTH domain
MTGQHLQDLMKQEGYSVNKMAELIGKSQQVLSSALKHDDVRTGLLEDIAKAMGKPLAFFYGETYGPVSQVNGNNNTSVAGNDNTVSNDDRLLSLLMNKDEQLTLTLKQTEKAMDQTAEAMKQTTFAMEQAYKSQGQIDELIKMINR